MVTKMVKKAWGDGDAVDALLARLQLFLPVPSKSRTLADYLGVGYPLFGNAGERWAGIREMGFPILVTKDRILTECYVRAICPEGRETVVLHALDSGSWKIPNDLQIRVWTPQPKKKSAPAHALPETVLAFKDAGIGAVKFMDTVKTPENSFCIPEMKLNISRPFYEDWISVMRSGDPYICFLPERKPSRTVQGVRWFQSVFGLSFNGDNRKLTKEDIQPKVSGHSSDDALFSQQAIWLWKVRECAVHQSGMTGPLIFGMKLQLDKAAKEKQKTDKEQAALMLSAGTYLWEKLSKGEASEVKEAIHYMKEDVDLSWWYDQMIALDEQVREQGLNVTF